MAKKKISRAAQVAGGFTKEEFNALRKAYQAEKDKNIKLTAENKHLRSALQKLKKGGGARARRQEVRSVKGQEKQLTRPRAIKKPSLGHTKKDIGKTSLRIVDLEKMSKSGRRHYYLETLYVPQFMKRIHKHFGAEWNQGWDEIVVNILMGLKKKDLDELMDYFDISNVLYESDQYYVDEGDEWGWTAEEIYETILEYKD